MIALSIRKRHQMIIQRLWRASKLAWKTRKMSGKLAGDVVTATERMIYVEFSGIEEILVPQWAFAMSLARNSGSRVVYYAGYVAKASQRRVEGTLRLLGSKFLQVCLARILTGAQVYIPKTNKEIERRASLAVEEMKKEIKSRKDLESWEYSGYLVGDLLYDSYLRQNKAATVVFNEAFWYFAQHFMRSVLCWMERIEGGYVEAVCVSHTVYSLAIPVRIGVRNNVKCFQVTDSFIYRLSSERLFAYNDFKSLGELARLTDEKTSRVWAERAKERIEQRMHGKVGVDMSYSTKSGYHKQRLAKIIEEGEQRVVVLIAAHDFLDSPHAYGNSIFCDFWEWINEIGKLSEDLDYKWLVKCHRDYRVESLSILRRVCEKYPRLELINSEYSHNQLIEEGVDLVLTVYGTIGFEYAYRGIKVVNASLNNPHIGFSFNSNPSNKGEWIKEISQARKRSDYEKPSQEEVCLYYYLKHMHNKARRWLCSSDDKDSRHTALLHLERLQRSMDDSSVLTHFDAYSNFVKSKDFKFGESHYTAVLTKEN